MAAAKSNTNWFAIGVSAAVVVILVVLGGLVVFLNNQATSPGATPGSNQTFNSETGAVTVGDGKAEDEVKVFVDFQCPVCKSFEDQYGAALESKAEDGSIVLEYHPIAILDRYSQGTEYSSRSAGAAVCVAESNPELYLDYAKALFANQPAENSSGLTTDELAAMATQVGADDSVECITDETYRKFGAAQAKSNDIRGTPTVEVNGTRLDLQNPADMKKFTDLLG
jgi:protein-disulfide isomerase